MEIQELLPEAPYLTDEMVLDMYRKHLSHYLFYRKHKTYIDCFCTSCMKRYQVRRDTYYISHKEKIECFNCGADVTCYSEGISRDKLYQCELITYFIAKDNKVYAYCLRLFNSRTDKYDIEGMEKACTLPYYIDHVIEYAPQSVRSFSKEYGFWSEKEFTDEVYIRTGLYQYKYYNKLHNSEVIQNSFLKYSLPDRFNNERIKEVYENKPLLYLSFAAKYPAFEMLCKLGSGYIIKDIIVCKKKYKSVLNLSGKSCAEVFRTDSNEAALILQAIQRGESLDIEVLQCLRKLKSIARKSGRKYTLADALKICGIPASSDIMCKLIKKTNLTPQKLVNYLNKQLRERKNVKWQSLGRIIGDYEDYIHECEQLGYNVTDEQICKPKDMYAAHERTSKAVNIIERERMEKAEQERTTAYLNGIYKEYVDKYEYSDKRYSIIVPKSAPEIVDEGKNQHHCVAGYADRHITGKLAILFMRDTASIENALYTIEMHDNELVQIRGQHNCDPTKEARKFVDKWLKWVKLPENKKHPERILKGA